MDIPQSAVYEDPQEFSPYAHFPHLKLLDQTVWCIQIQQIVSHD